MSISSIPVQSEDKPKPKFIFLEKSSVIDAYESYGKEGFEHLLSGGFVNNSTEQAKRPYEQEKRFLSVVSVQSIIRTVAVDYNSPKREGKEMMYYTTQWEAKD
jgi:hypothetical protein